MKKWFLALALFFPALMQGIDYKPWYLNFLQMQGFLDYRFQTYHSVDAPHKNNHYASNDHFVDGSLIFVYDPFSFQLETEFADTKKRHFDWDHVSLTGRYLWLNDDRGDLFSLTTGLTLSRAWREAVNDISSFHHGRNEAFLHAAIGKQDIQGSTWLSRWWGVLGIGTADRWTPWIAAQASYECNIYEPHRLRLSMNTLWGCGNKKLKIRDFGGYGPIDHRSIDLSLRYSYEFDYYGILSLEFAHRVYAHNFPDHASIVSISYNYPFGPEGDYLILKVRSFFSTSNLPF